MLVFNLTFRVYCLCTHFNCATQEKNIFIFRPQPCSGDFLSSLPPFCACVFLSSLYVIPPLPPPPSPQRPCGIGGVNTGRERALFHHARAGRSCRAPAPGSKVYCGFHFTFPQPITESHWRSWTLTPAKNSTKKMVWRQFHNSTSSHLPFSPYYSFSFLSTG